MVDPDELSAYLMVLKDAGVHRARLDGIGEIEFESAVPEIVQERVVEMPLSDRPQMTPPPSEPQSGYAKLFGAEFPSFKKPTNGGSQG